MILSDNEIRNLDKDFLSYRAFAETLNEIIVSSQTPLTIGVFGEWGSGKTSLLRLTQTLVDKSKIEKNKIGKIKSIWFDAWKYDKAQDLRVALIHLILKTINEDSSIGEKVKNKTNNLLSRINWIGLGKTVASTSFNLMNSYLNILPLLNKVLDKETLEKFNALNTESIINKPNEIKNLEFLGEFENEFRELIENYVGKSGRLVVFVDDLDRCIPEKALDILETIKLFLFTSQTVFLIGADREIIINGITEKYKSDSKKWGENYLDKIIQVPFTLRPLRKEIITEQFIKNLPISDTIKEHSNIISQVGTNPRTIKRLLNNFEFQRILASKRQLKNVEESVLAKLTVLEFRWPKFYSSLLNLYTVGNEFNLIRVIVQNETDLKDGNSKVINDSTLIEFQKDEMLLNFLKESPNLNDIELENYIYLAKSTAELRKDSESLYQIALATENNEDAIEYLNEVIEDDKRFEKAYSLRAYHYFHLGNYSKSIEDSSTAISLEYKNADVYNLRGLAYHKIGEHKKAKDDYEKSISIDEYNYNAIHNRGKIHLKEGNEKLAIEGFKKVIEINPDYCDVYESITPILKKRKQYNVALNYLNYTIQKNHSFNLGYKLRGGVYEENNQIISAIKDYTTYLEIEPEDDEAYDFLKNAILKIGKSDEDQILISMQIADRIKSLDLNKAKIRELNRILKNPL